MTATEAVIRGVASILQEASAALAKLGMQAIQQQTMQIEAESSRDREPAGSSLADAAAALAQVASQFSGGRAPVDGDGEDSAEQGSDDGADASMSTTEFITTHHLESWVGEALDLLTPEQRIAVMDTPMNTCHARNLNGIVISRIKQAVPLDQRLGIFVQINGLSEGVVDRISTLTPDQAEAVMESGLKIQKAANPSGVAMRRISDVLKTERQGKPLPSAVPTLPTGLLSASSTSGSRDRSRTPATHSRGGGQASISDTPDDVQTVVRQLGLEWWCGEVLKRLSLWQRQQVLKDIQNVSNARNPSGIVMSRVKSIAEISELMSIFIDINQFDGTVQNELWALTPEQQNAVISPGIFLQNVRNPSIAVRSRIKNVLAGNDAFGKPL